MPPKLEDLQNIPNAVQPTAGQGLTLDLNGLLPVVVLAKSPVDLYVLTYDATTQQQKWAAISPSSLTGYPSDVTKVLLGDGTWAQVANAQISASAAIAYSKLNLANSIVTGDIVNGTIVDADISGSAAIAYSKLNLASSIVSGDIVNGTIVDADVSGSAALGIAKLAGYPTDATKFLRGDATWSVPSGATAPTFLPGAAAFTNTSRVVVANTAYLIPIPNVVATTVLTRITFGILTLVAGNYDVGIYSSDDEATFTRLGSLGSTAQPGAQIVTATLSSQTITPVTGRRWYYGIALSSASTLNASGTGGGIGTGLRGFTKATSFPLPSSLTSMTADITSISMPVVHGEV